MSAEPRQPPATHRYRVACRWDGTTAGGYEAYSRDHRGSADPAASTLELSSDPAFRGNPARLNPEQLLVLAASSCQLLSFLAVAARARIDVRGYDDDGEGVMPEAEPPARLTRIVLRPRIRVAAGTSTERVLHLVEVAHRECFIANSLNTEILVEAIVDVLPAEASSDPVIAEEGQDLRR